MQGKVNLKYCQIISFYLVCEIYKYECVNNNAKILCRMLIGIVIYERSILFTEENC